MRSLIILFCQYIYPELFCHFGWLYCQRYSIFKKGHLATDKDHSLFCCNIFRHYTFDSFFAGGSFQILLFYHVQSFIKQLAIDIPF